ncbi:MAG: DUF5684 domain-containing protein [Candidatus Zixiibacteriota bacterium]
MYESTYGGGFGAYEAAVWLFWLAVYFYWAFAQYKIAMKTGHDNNAWWAFIPILNIYQWTELAGRPWYWFVLCLVPFVNLVFIAWLWVDIAKYCGQPTIWGVLFLIPPISLISLGVLGFSSPPKPSVFPSEKPAPRQPTQVG